jgi:hypothetical protein
VIRLRSFQELRREKPAEHEKAGEHENRSALNSAKVSTPAAAPPPRVKHLPRRRRRSNDHGDADFSRR